MDEAPQNEMPEHFPYLLEGQLQQERPALVGRAIAVRTHDWTYVFRLYENDEIYDRRSDPHETTNIAGAPEHETARAALRDEILRWLVSTSDVIPSLRDPRIEPDLFDQFLGASRATPPG
jgi:arylsulfatase A-like enzyme